MSEHPPDAAPLLALRGIGKSFGGIRALHDVSLQLWPGEVLALLGDNGAGKSTLVKILSGVHAPDAGEMRIRGESVHFRSYCVETARRLGIETVHQERSLGEQQPLWRNVFVGRHLANRLGFIDVRREKAITMDLLRHRLGLRARGLDAAAAVAVLSGGERQGLAIARAMHFRSDILVLDEPTTALSLAETRKVLDFMGQVRAAGRSCIFISHNMRHAYLAADRFVILDHGRVAACFAKAGCDEETLLGRVMDAAGSRSPA
ncbi:MAG: ATP-binding cassette domain-containing protein [Solidesulfovibrio sp. DCME]|uniref:ATP-binding cassette domain-containing protein n=1 Tax=Solidesulfovibrio sp. DCME TaxID=3447380 RepID=UPI003D12C7A6